MECNYCEIEKKFSNYVIKLIGPSSEQDLFRDNKFKIIKSVLEKAIEDQGVIPHIFSFGSYPIKTYLPESDMDVTIILEDMSTNQIITNLSLDLQNKILNLIQYSLENYNQEVGFQQITEISMIPAEVKLIKCKFDNLSFDISLNNFVGLIKMSFMHYLETTSFDQNLFKRTLFLIKCWSYYEGSILGSNVGLLASYGLEVLIIYMFNKYSDDFTNEIEAVFTFFRLMNDIDWNKNIITIFGCLDIDTYFEKLKSNQYILHDVLKEMLLDKSKISIDLLINFGKNYEKLTNIEKMQNSGKKVIDIRLMNIIDPLFHTNNLGKSVNYHNYSKIKKVFEFASGEAARMQKCKQNKSINPFDYLNSLLKFFSKIIVNNNPELFFMSLPQPKIIIFPKEDFLSDNEDEEFTLDFKKKEVKKDPESYPNQLNEDLINTFNKQFTLNEKENVSFENEAKISSSQNGNLFTNFQWPTNLEIKSDSEINNILSSYYNQHDVHVTKEIVENLLTDQNTVAYEFQTFEEITEIEDYIQHCKI